MSSNDSTREIPISQTLEELLTDVEFEYSDNVTLQESTNNSTSSFTVRDVTNEGVTTIDDSENSIRTVGDPVADVTNEGIATNDDAKTWLSNYSECKLGFTGLVTYSHASQVHKVVEHVDIDRILLETDAPYFLPSGARKNSMNCSFPGHVIYVAAKIAKLKKMTLEQVLIKNILNSKLIYKRFFEQ